MRIYSMTATFGKLEHETLTFQPGLNIIEAPNEWGKSTWCAFLVNMLYGIETRAKTTKAALADKERYAPWSGAPMSGRIDLCWNGRDITIERRTKGRLIFGEFRAYETATGIEIPELNSVNCGQQLLGVERSVFTRAGFLKLSDLPVTQDDSLRRRLNNLVTTGDESGAGDKLAQTLKDLKNKCRYNRSGLLPQAESEREQLRDQLNILHDLQNKAEEIRAKQSQLEKTVAQLENHKKMLQYTASLANFEKVHAADAALEQAKQQLVAMEESCKTLPDRASTEQNLNAALILQDEWLALQLQPTPQQPIQPELPELYQNLYADDIRRTAQEDHDRLNILRFCHKRQRSVLMVLAILSLLLCIGSVVFARITPKYDLFFVSGISGLCTVILSIISFYGTKNRKALEQLYARHPDVSPDQWIGDAEQYAVKLEQYQTELTAYQLAMAEQQQQRGILERRTDALTGGMPLKQCQTQWEQVITQRNALDNARRDLIRMENHAKDLRSMTTVLEKPSQPDVLTYSEDQTDALLASCKLGQKQLQLRLGQCIGQAEALGQESQLKARLELLNRRIDRLEDTYYALEMAQDALRDATTTLQRRFAPRISKRAQELFSKLTGGRYQRITLDQEFNLHTSAEDEDTLRSSQWRSDGTIDQLYLALRLAVAEELTPQAPLVLDDALVRFDDARLKVALEILKETAQDKQVLLFTCQSREKNL